MEFAVVGSALALLLLGGIDAARTMLALAAVRTAAADAARMATLAGGANIAAERAPCAGLAGALAGTQRRAPILDPARLSVRLSGCATAGAVTTVTVTATYRIRLSIPLAGALERSMSETAQAVIY
ncbi:hypothetical protein [Falsiroseomonas sp. CW058]|uniref:hypothetical protein n=1 Tax=Falsiroseomonas sp. CW058 TaxID=3388664 RepID=UPI003D319A72